MTLKDKLELKVQPQLDDPVLIAAPVNRQKLKISRHETKPFGIIISQNGNAYEEGLGGAWASIQRYWSEPSSENREAIRKELTPGALKWQYTHGTPNPDAVAPEGYTLDAAMLARPGNEDIQLDLFLNYATNVALYPAFQKYFREHQPPLLAIWGKNDVFFIPAGAEAYRRDIPNAHIQFLDTGHFALETHVVEIAQAIQEFLS